MKKQHSKHADRSGAATCGRWARWGRTLLVWATPLLLVGCRGIVAQLEELHVQVTRDADGRFSVTCQRTKNTDKILKRVRQLAHVRSIVLNETDVTDRGLSGLAELTGLEALRIGVGRQITDAGLAELARLQDLKELALVGTRVTDEGMKHVAALRGLRQLSVSDVSDAGFHQLRQLAGLEQLELLRADITPAGVEDLQALRQLRSLALIGCHLSDANLDELRRGLPDCRMTVAADRAP